MNLLVDIGNTRLKWGTLRDGRIATGEPQLHNTTGLKRNLHSAWRNIQPSPQRLAISCVGPDSVLVQVIETAMQLWPLLEIIPVKSESVACGVFNGYDFPEKLGVDRWLCLIAARNLWQTPLFIVDCGTAITIDFMDERGHHQGGVISPGITLMKQSLSKGTSALPFTGRVCSVGLARTTEEAIFSGTLLAATGLIKTALSYRQAQLPQLVLTGGDAELVARYLEYEATVVPDLVLHGLSRILEGR